MIYSSESIRPRFRRIAHRTAEEKKTEKVANLIAPRFRCSEAVAPRESRCGARKKSGRVAAGEEELRNLFSFFVAPSPAPTQRIRLTMDPIETLATLSTAVTELQTALSPILAVPLVELLAGATDSLEKAKLDVTLAYVVHDLIWSTSSLSRPLSLGVEGESGHFL